MTLPSISIRRIETDDPAGRAELEAFLENDLVTTSAPSASALNVASVPAAGYSWMRVERSFAEGAARYFVTLDSPGSSETAGGGGENSSSAMGCGLRTFSLPEGVSVTQVLTGDFGHDGTHDILLWLSDGALMLIESQEEGEATEPVETEIEEPPVEPYDPEPYDPEPVESPRSVQAPASPSSPLPPSSHGGQIENPSSLSPSAKEGI